MSEPSEPGQVRDAFEDLRITTLPRITPPGVDAARRTVHRRRARRVAVACVAVGLAALGGVSALVRPWSGPSTPVGVPPATTTPTPWASPTPSAPPSSASASPTTRLQNPGQGGPPACARDGVGVSTATDSGYQMNFSPVGYTAKVPCAGVRVKVWAAYYYTNPDGTRTLINTEVSYLSAATRSIDLHPAGGPCVTWVIGSGTGTIPGQLPEGDEWLNQPGPDGPFWDADHAQSGVREASIDNACPTEAPSPSAAEPEPTPTP